MSSTTAGFPFGVLCKIGYGYNSTLNYFYKFDDANPQNVTSIEYKGVSISHVLNLSCTSLVKYELGQLLEEQALKRMDFQIINDDRDCYQFFVFIWTKKETCSSCEKLPENTEYYVKEVFYGTYLDIIVPKNEFPDKREEMEKLLNSAVKDINKLTENQKHTKCRVLINYVEEREMTLEDVFKFNNECLEGQHPGYQIVLVAELEKNKHTPFVVKNDVNFQRFLLHVYTAYRKIEMIMEAAGHPRIVPVPDRATAFSRIISNLAKAKKKYTKLNLKDDDVSKIYRVLKTLFWNYRHYLEYVIEKRLDIDEGNDLPPGWEEGADLKMAWKKFDTLFKKLNNWILVKIGNQWYSSEYKLLVVPDGFEEVEAKIKQLIPGIVVKRDNKLTEPHLFIHPKINGSFGSVDMSRPSPNTAPTETMEYLRVKCPETCSENKLQWICQECGGVVRTGDFKLICSCGTKLFDGQLLTCNDVKHKIRSMKTEKLKTIALQLRKHQDKDEHDDATKNAIKNAVKSLVKVDQETDEISVLMKQMKNLNVFDGDTSHLIDKYLTEHPR